MSKQQQSRRLAYKIVVYPEQVGQVFRREGGHFGVMIGTGGRDGLERWWRWVISDERSILGLERRLGCQRRDYRCGALKRSYD